MELELKSIKELLDNSFFIPSYQRGYRWEERQVLDLLQDIYEFSLKPKIKGEFYCLQPIVVKEKSDNTTNNKNDKDNNENNKHKCYSVIDGQQRLTTIYIILKYLQNIAKEFENLKSQDDEKIKKILEFCDIEEFEIEKIYEIKYETRKEKNKYFFETKLSQGENYENPDFYYMSKAYQTIKNWFKNKSKKQFLDTLLNDVKVIWYEIDNENNKKEYEINKNNEKEYEIEVFTRLNIGKIPLTNAELIKAMLLMTIKDYNSQIEFATIWDNIEKTLQNNEFWYFLTNKKKSETAIDLIFDTLAKKYKNNKDFKISIKIQENDPKFSFYILNEVLKLNLKKEKNIWEDAQKIFRCFVDWYNNSENYHKVGYLLTFKNRTLLGLIENYENKNKKDFSKYLNNKIKESIETKELSKLKYGNKEIKKILLLFNIETILQNNNSSYRFSFFSFKEKKWDIEHIASQTENENKKEWIRAVLKYIYGRDEEKINEKIEFFEKKFERFFTLVKKQLNIKDLDENLKNNIGNLTLLDSKINRSYKNAFFPIKRAIIIEEDSKGNFIPPATKNVFLKQYSNKLSDMMNWTEDDIKAYENEIIKLLEKYGISN
jgi:uncharacterized protein with ParB-like and HNH nuclease domain